MEGFTVHVSLPDSLHRFLMSQVAEGRCNSANEFIVDLLRAAQKAAASSRLDELVQEGLDSGMAPLTEQDWEELRRRLEERVRRESA
ncbi:MAG: hypothetical protein KDA21_02455 [Phycisphaerales bacterium]|nr:hypothetical protein [Phycisphaerales bacterium]